MRIRRCYTPPVRRARLFLIGLMVMAPGICAAETIFITPTLDLSPSVAQLRTEDTEHSSAIIQGTGDRLSITYTSPVRIDVDFVPIRRGNGYDPAEMAHFSLPPSKDGEAIVDLKVTGGWWPFAQQYKFSFFHAAGKPDITGIDFVPWTWAGLFRGIGMHIAMRETWQVSTFHTLRGSSVLSIPLSAIVGIVTVGAVAIFFWLGRNKKPLPNLLTVLIIGSLAYTAWSGIDLLRFSAGHLREWTAEGTYSKEGSAGTMAKAIWEETEKSREPLFVFVCSDVSDFYAKALRYALYPIPVSVKNEDIARATHVVVSQKVSWQYKDGILTCGPISGKARKLAEFNDSSVLFSSSK